MNDNKTEIGKLPGNPLSAALRAVERFDISAVVPIIRLNGRKIIFAAGTREKPVNGRKTVANNIYFTLWD